MFPRSLCGTQMRRRVDLTLPALAYGDLPAAL